ncbi:two-component sensor histidine kinase [Mycolicibacterium cosmeticum]|uniref:sensor histidine kinase n=1 Tax=Mycolicibacterium cosmeticum TaxID=258533 RepID=UPI0006885196|nr:histidine kinase [Mycolicibacterium cosmeticum]TLH81328.1 two-component sensor histidine kinase [Mycolicibacterium cosmeticum]
MNRVNRLRHWHWSTWLVVVVGAIMYAIAWPTLFLTHQVPAGVAPIVAALAAWPLLLVVTNPLLGWSISAGAAAAIPLFFDRLPGWTYPWQVVHLIELLVLIAAVAWTRSLPTVLKVWAASALLFLIAMPADADAGWAFGVTAIVFGVVLVRGLVLSRRKVAQLEEEGELERARRTVLQERSRIARDLHDVVAHHMSLVVVSAQTAPYRHADVPPRLQAEFETIAATGRQALNEIRGLLGVLRSDTEVAELAPTPTITDLPELFAATQRAGVQLTWQIDGPTVLVGELIGATAYRIVQECLANAARHAPGSPVAAEVSITVDGVGIEVRNRPASTAPWPAPSPGLGITGMRERAGAVGGIVAVHADDDEFVVWSYLPAVPATVAPCPV